MGGGAYALDIPGTHLSAYTISGVRVDATAETVAAARSRFESGTTARVLSLASRLGVLTEHVPDLDSEALSHLVLGGDDSTRGPFFYSLYRKDCGDIFSERGARYFRFRECPYF